MTSAPEFTDHNYPDWHPDGGRLLFTRRVNGGDPELLTMRADGTDVVSFPFAEPWARWAPEGNGLLTTSRDTNGNDVIVSIGLDESFLGGHEYVSLDPGTEASWPDFQPLGPPPGLTGVSGRLVAGAPVATILIDGVGFVPRSVVRWNGADRTTTYRGPTRLEAQLSAADLPSPGTGQVSVFTSPAGGGLSATRTVAIEPGPPPLRASISTARFAVTWTRSRPRGQLRVAGSLERAARIELAVVLRGRILLRRVASISGGPFVRSLQVGGRLLPGRYTVRVREITPDSGIPALVSASRQVVLKAPQNGVVSASSISSIGPRGPAITRKPSASVLFARFTLAARPARGRPIVTEWFLDGAPVPGTRITRPSSKRIVAIVRSGRGLPKGSWRCVLRSSGTTLAVASVRVG